MTQPRDPVAGKMWHATHAATNRQKVWTPRSREMVELWQYVLGLMCERYNVSVLAVCVLSNHFHLLLLDHDGRLPDFMWDLGRHIAWGTPQLTGCGSQVMNRNGYHPVHVGDREAFEKIVAYIIANPTAAGIVENPYDWEGLTHTVKQQGTFRKTVQRPDCLKLAPFKDQKPTVEFRLDRPPKAFQRATLRETRAKIQGHLDEMIENAKARLEEEGRTFAGMERARRVNPLTPGPTPTGKNGRRTYTPRVHCGCRTLASELRQRRKQFVRRYREALEAHRDGDTHHPFPYGTWQRRLDGAPCEPAPDWGE